MAAKETIRYRGHTIRLWHRSYQVDNNAVLFIGVKPDVREIKRLIDASLTGEYKLFSQTITDPVEVKRLIGNDWKPFPLSWRRRLALALDDARDIADQVPIGWLLAIAFVAGSLTTCGIAWIVTTFLLTGS